MGDVQALQRELAELEARKDLDGVRRVRERLVAEHPEHEAAAEARYKIGLDVLFRGRNMAEAVEHFEAAAKAKHAYWSAAARTSMALCLYHQKRTQKAYFELRKVAYAKQVSQHSVTALVFLEQWLLADNQAAEVERVRRERATQLQTLLGDARLSPVDRGHALLLWGMTLKELGDAGGGRAKLQEALALGGEALGPDLVRQIKAALA